MKRRIVLFCLLQGCLFSMNRVSHKQTLLHIMSAFFVMHNVDCTHLRVDYPNALTTNDYINNCVMNFSFEHNPRYVLSVLIPCSPLSIFQQQIDMLIKINKETQGAHIVLKNDNLLPIIKDLLNSLKA